jgi:putative flippase GtrA
MTPTTLAASTFPSTIRTGPVVDIVVPVYNEERDLGPSIRRLHSYLTDHFPFTFRVTIADNASTDATWSLARRLSAELPHVTAVHLPAKGRGGALRAVWADSDAEVVAYTDVDLSTDLAGLLPLVAPLVSGHSDVAIGSRLARGASVSRGPKREVISRAYNVILKATLGAHFSDAQCGFKAVRADVARRLLPLVEDTGWFFDTELLVLAERSGLRIHEVPVDWVDDPDSRVDLVATALADLRGVARLGWGFTTGALSRRLPGSPRQTALGGQLLRFAGIGVLSTLSYLALYAALRTLVGPLSANAVALAVTAVANTAANRRLTFGVRGRRGSGYHHAVGLVTFGAGLALTSGALATLAAVAPHAGRVAELAVLVLANAAATLLRFVALRLAFVHRAPVGEPA